VSGTNGSAWPKKHECGISGIGSVDQVLAISAERAPDVLADALRVVLGDDGHLADYAGHGLAILFRRSGGQSLARSLLKDGLPPTRAAVARGLAENSAPWATDVLDRLAADEDKRVRSAVAYSTGWAPARSRKRLLIGLRACLPASLGEAVAILSRLRWTPCKSAPLPTPLSLDDDAAKQIRELVKNAAAEPNGGGSELGELAQLVAMPRLVLEARLARVQWLALPEVPLEVYLSTDALLDETAARAQRPDHLAAFAPPT
jgi:hypothetical protein